MPLAGGAADKAGNRFERRWSVLKLLDVLEGEAESLQVEVPGEGGAGAEFRVVAGGGAEWHQVKRQRAGRPWTIASLASEGVLLPWWEKIQAGDRCVFVSGSGAAELAELVERASAAESWAVFEQEFLKPAVQRWRFERLGAAWGVVADQAVYEALASIDVVLLDEPRLKDTIELRLEALVEGPPPTAAALLDQLVADSTHRVLTAADVWARLDAHGMAPKRGSVQAASESSNSVSGEVSGQVIQARDIHGHVTQHVYVLNEPPAGLLSRFRPSGRASAGSEAVGADEPARVPWTRHVRSKRFVVVPVGVGLVLALLVVWVLGGRLGDAGESSSPSSAACERESDGTLTIGGLLPLSGELASAAPASAAAAQVAVDEVNRAGGVLGHDLDYRPGDSGDLGDGIAAGKLEDHLAHGADVILGAANDISEQLIGEIVDACRVQISPFASRAKVTAHGDNDLFFRTIAPDNLQGRALAGLAKDEGAASAAIVHLKDDYGNDMADHVRDSFVAVGGEVTISQPYEPASSDLPSDVQRAIATNPDTLFVLGCGESAEILQEFFEQGFTAGSKRIYLTDCNIGDWFAAMFDDDDALAGVAGLRPRAEASPDLKHRIDEVAPDLPADQFAYDFAPEIYDAIIVTALAANTAETDNPVALASKIKTVTRGGTKCSRYAECVELIEQGEGIDYDGASGRLELSEAGEPTAGSFMVLRYGAGNRISDVDYRNAALPDSLPPEQAGGSDGEGPDPAQRCHQAVDELRSDDIDIRFEAIEDLDEMRDECQQLRDRVVRALVRLIKSRSPYEPHEASDNAPGELSANSATLKDVYLAARLLVSEDFVPSTLTLDLDHVDLSHFQLDITADLEGADLSGWQIDYFSHLPDADLRNTNLTATQLDHAMLTNANLDGATAIGAYFPDAILDGASFDGTNLTGADFTGRGVTGPACLNNADLDGAIGLDEAKLDGAIANRATTWPEGFEPEAHGVRLNGPCRVWTP